MPTPLGFLPIRSRALKDTSAWRAGSALLLLLLGTGTQLAAATAVDRLQQEAETAATALTEERSRIEAERRGLIAAIDAQQAAIRAAQQAVDQEHQALDQARQAQERLQSGMDDSRLAVAPLARDLAGAGLPVDPRSSAAELRADWPAIETAVADRLADWQVDLTPRLADAELLDRAGRPVTVPVWHWGAAQRLALGSSASSAGIALRLDDGSWQVAGPQLDASPDDPRQRPIDLTGRLALATPSDAGALALLRRAGPFAWPILALALLGILLIADRCWLLWRWRMPRDLVDRLIADLDRPAAATDRLRRQRAPSTRMLRELVGDTPRDSEAVQAMGQRAGAALVEAEVRLQRGLRLLAVLAAAAPLLGLLGTVTGMITSFRALDLGGGGNAGQLSAGIGEALLTTEFGLIVAVPLLLAHAIFARDAQRRRSQAESAAMRLLAAQQHRLAPGAALEPRGAEPC